MHLQMTVVWENGGHAPVEVLVDAPAGSTGADLADGLRSLLDPTGSSHPAHPARHLRVTGAPVLDDDLLGEGALVDGAVLTVAGDQGTGLQTILCQTVAAEMEVPYDAVRCRIGATSDVPYSVDVGFGGSVFM